MRTGGRPLLTLAVIAALLPGALLAPTKAGTRRAATAAGQDGEWTMPAKDYASTRFSSSHQITPANATRLRPSGPSPPASCAATRASRSWSSNTMYVVTPWPNVLYAFDLTQEGYPLKWKYRPDVSPNAIGVACCDAVNRGAFYADGKIIYNLLDGHTVAVDAESGQGAVEDAVRRRRPRRDHADGAVRGQGPRHRRRLGRRVRHPRLGQGARSQDRQDRLDGPQHRPRRRRCWPSPAPSSRSTTRAPISAPRAGRTRPRRPAARRSGAGCPTTPSSTCVYYGVGNPAPYNAEQRPGDNKWTGACSRAGPATARWYGPTSSPRTTTGTTTPSPSMILADVKVGGQRRKALVHFNKNGFAYTLDRATGEVLVAEPYVAGQLGQEHRSHDRPPGARLDQAHRRVQGAT